MPQHISSSGVGADGDRATGLGRRGFLGVLGAAGALALPGFTASPAAAAATPRRTGGGGPGRQVITGVDALAARRWTDLAGQRVGVITNPTGILADLRHGVDVMAADDNVDLVAVFGPEHGFRAAPLRQAPRRAPMSTSAPA